MNEDERNKCIKRNRRKGFCNRQFYTSLNRIKKKKENQGPHNIQIAFNAFLKIIFTLFYSISLITNLCFKCFNKKALITSTQKTEKALAT